MGKYLTNPGFSGGIGQLLLRGENEMECIGLEQQDGVALVRLNRGVINAINQSVINELDEVLQVCKHDSAVRGLVLTSNNDKFFSIGFDLPALYPLPREEFGAFFRAFNLLCLDLFTFPKPIITAITGHATAGGCILALCADYRFIAEGRRLIGVNESKLGVPITHLANLLLRQLLGQRQAREAVSSGTLYPPEEASRIGMVDGVYSLAKVVSAAIQKARDIGEMPGDGFAANKRLWVRGIEAQVIPYLEEEERLFLDQWYAPTARQHLKDALAKFTRDDESDG
jgi:3,2-trans-enoyl-CoA isomerase